VSVNARKPPDGAIMACRTNRTFVRPARRWPADFTAEVSRPIPLRFVSQNPAPRHGGTGPTVVTFLATDAIGRYHLPATVIP
jgi:hypothetical protein